MNRQITVGMLAHVDAGKTTLTESLLYKSGTIRKLGRVDHRDSFLDTDPIERERGITVFAKQARMTIGETDYTLLDTPGHADLSAEMERSLWVMDYAILLISAQEGVTSQVKILWKLLEHYEVPAYIFVNKMDRPECDREKLLLQIREKLGNTCQDFSDQEAVREAVALTDEKLLEAYLEGKDISKESFRRAIKERDLHPVFFGAALKNDGTEELMQGMSEFMEPTEYKESFGARVFKISKDPKGGRMTWLKVSGGKLSVKQNISYLKDGEQMEEKVDQIRLYSGNRFEAVKEASTGTVCAVTGLSGIAAGSALGSETSVKTQIIEPVLTYEIISDPQIQTPLLLERLRSIEEEEPKLHVKYSPKSGKISVQVMGKVQMEILKRQMKERFETEISFGAQTIAYKETISKTSEGVGHFEPLRHYAEVRLLLEPLERGSGIQIENLCPREELEPHWQRLILSHLKEREHCGILMNAELTDMRISLLGGRAHTKHTEPGDFRQATFRALRQGLMENVSELLEPYYEFQITLPEANLGRLLYDLNQMEAKNDPPILRDGEYEIVGRGPARSLGNYQEELTLYSAGKGKIRCSFSGYEICQNAEQIIDAAAYDPDRDLENPSSSVFCSHGAGIIIPWYQVKERMHTESSLSQEEEAKTKEEQTFQKRRKEEELTFKERGEKCEAAEKELQEIFERTYGAKGKQAARPGWKYAKKVQENTASTKAKSYEKKKIGKEYLLVDGYNIIFAWEELKALAAEDIGAARDKLMDIMSNFQGSRDGSLILVFDAYKVSGGKERVTKYHNIYVVYTRESETADQYIEKTVHDIAKNNRVTVATSDGLEQMIILGEGAVRLSAGGLLAEVENRQKELNANFILKREKEQNFAFENIPKEVQRALQESEKES